MSKLTWRSLNNTLHSLSEAKVLALLEEELKNERRLSILRRLHQRYTALRADRERIEILTKAEKI